MTDVAQAFRTTLHVIRSGRREIARVLRHHRRLRLPPGQRAAYTNLGYLVLGEVIAAATGQPFVDFMTREQLEPPGMHRTGFAHADNPLDIATGYWRLPRGVVTALRLLRPTGIVDGRVDGLVAFSTSTD